MPAKRQVTVPEVTSVKVLIDEGRVKTEFTGLWTKKLIDAAYRMMLRDFPAHFLKERDRLNNINKEE